MSDYRHSALASCPDLIPENLMTLPQRNCLAPNREEVILLYENFLAQTNLLISGTLIINPAEMSTVAFPNQVRCRSVKPVLGDMHPNFSLFIAPDMQNGANGLFIKMHKIERINDTSLEPRYYEETFNYRLDSAGNGRYEKKARPFEYACGGFNHYGDSQITVGQLTLKDLGILDKFYGDITSSLVLPAAVAEAEFNKTALRKYLGRRMLGLFSRHPRTNS